MLKELTLQGLIAKANSALKTATYRDQSPTLPYVRPAAECLAELLPAGYQAEAQIRAAKIAAFQGLTDFAQNHQPTEFSPSGARFTGAAELTDQYAHLRATALEAGWTPADIASIVSVGSVHQVDRGDDVFRNNLRLNGHV